MRGTLAASWVFVFLVLSFASRAQAQHLETTPAAVVDSEDVEVAYRAFSTEEGADASEIGVVTGIAPAFDVGVVAPRPMFSTHQPQAPDAEIAFRRVLHGGGEGPRFMLAAAGSAAKPLGNAPSVTLAVSHVTRSLAWHSNVGHDGGLFATTRFEGPLWWRLRPAVEVRQEALAIEALGVGALMQLSDQLTIDAGARFSVTARAPTLGAGLTYVLPKT
jgi:hypothetical protein